jgi:hypothetical protein
LAFTHRAYEATASGWEADVDAQEGSSFMSTVFRSRVLLVLAVFAPVILALQSASAHAQTQIVRPPQRSPTLAAEKEKMTPGRSASLAACSRARLSALLRRSPASWTTDRICMFYQ